jgi:hypothetical protein
MTFEKKYLKYKTKYLNLKNMLNEESIFMHGGSRDIMNINELTETPQSINFETQRGGRNEGSLLEDSTLSNLNRIDNLASDSELDIQKLDSESESDSKSKLKSDTKSESDSEKSESDSKKSESDSEESESDSEESSSSSSSQQEGGSEISFVIASKKNRKNKKNNLLSDSDLSYTDSSLSSFSSIDSSSSSL